MKKKTIEQRIKTTVSILRCKGEDIYSEDPNDWQILACGIADSHEAQKLCKQYSKSFTSRRVLIECEDPSRPRLVLLQGGKND